MWWLILAVVVTWIILCLLLDRIIVYKELKNFKTFMAQNGYREIIHHNIGRDYCDGGIFTAIVFLDNGQGFTFKTLSAFEKAMRA